MRLVFKKHQGARRRCWRGAFFLGILICNSLAWGAPPVPRLLHPPSMALLTTNQPELRWKLAGGGAVQIELCRDRACQQVVTTLHATGDSAKPATPLPAGVIFWRVLASTGGKSPVWQFVVRRRAAPITGDTGRVLDINGDGLADALVGWAVYLGSPSGLALQAAAVLDDKALQVARLAPAGDVNGDGFSDVLAAAPRGHAIHLYLGGTSGLPERPSETLMAPEKTSTFGEATAGIGDVNGDGFGDVVVGAPGLNKAYLYLGGPEGLTAQPAATLEKKSRHEHSSFGADVLGPGDVNGDGFDDFLILSSGNNYIHVFHGGPGGPALAPALSLFGGGDTQEQSQLYPAGDMNEDGYADVFYTSPEYYPAKYPRLLYGGAKGLSPAKIAFKLPGPPEGANGLGAGVHLTLQWAGDLNGDGHEDNFLVLDLQGNESALYLHYGGPEGQKRKPEVLLPLRVENTYRVQAVGDVNGDGFDDLLLELWQHGPKDEDRPLGSQLYLGGPMGVGKKPVQLIPPVKKDKR